jgi:hypothetical protein
MELRHESHDFVWLVVLVRDYLERQIMIQWTEIKK